MESNNIIENVVEKSYEILTNIMDKWCNDYDNHYNAGKMRRSRGEDIENFVKDVLLMIGENFNLKLSVLRGFTDKKTLQLVHNNEVLTKNHQVDIHIYKNDIFIAVIECKSYLDSCYYVRACDDFKLFKKFGYNIKNFVFTLENSIDFKTKAFTDAICENICDDVFYLLNGNRQANKPVYNKNFRKSIDKDKLEYFVKQMVLLLV